ncbi:hypothetical protein V7O62_09525 [Methanolobus sp. ZRKC2]|uniref:hypothetical protein n=1 Tax=Methanolobus sp. ZRKC2 TaxID=3125783 RepID=UPI003247887E
MLKNCFVLAMLIAIITLIVTGFASGTEDQTMGTDCVKTECFEETAWAAQCKPGDHRFVDRGNWATYTKYNLGTGTESSPVRYPIYAGQTYRAGTLKVYDETTYQSEGECGPGYYGTIYLRYKLSGSEPIYKNGYVGSWVGFNEYHLQVVDEAIDFNTVTTKKGNPIPGHFDYSKEYDPKTTDSGWIQVEVCGYQCDAYIAAHSVMEWCEYSKEV